MFDEFFKPICGRIVLTVPGFKKKSDKQNQDSSMFSDCFVVLKLCV